MSDVDEAVRMLLTAQEIPVPLTDAVLMRLLALQVVEQRRTNELLRDILEYTINGYRHARGLGDPP